MDEAEKYQQRLQAIAEKRRLQEEQERKRREMDDEKLRLQQLKRKSLRDQWLMEGPSSPDSSAPRSPVWGSQAQDIEGRMDRLQAESQHLAEQEGKLKQMEGEDDETLPAETDVVEEGQEGNVSPEAPAPAARLQRAPVQNGEEEHTVLGALEVQLEKDLKTGMTVIKSVAPVGPGGALCTGEKVFDDGSRSVHAAGGAVGAQPNPEELRHILRAVSGVGTTAEACVIVNGINERKEDGEEACAAVQGEHVIGVECDPNNQPQPVTAVMPRVNGAQGDESLPAGGDVGAITMTFLGFSEADPGQAVDGEDAGEIIRAERVIITDDGDDRVSLEKELSSEDGVEPSGPPENLSSNETSEPEAACTELDPETPPEPGSDSDFDKAASCSEGELGNDAVATDGRQEDGETVGPEVTESITSNSQSAVCPVELPSLTPKQDEEEDGVRLDGKAEQEPSTSAAQVDQFQEVPLDGEVKQEAQPLMGTAENSAKKHAPGQASEQQPLVSGSAPRGPHESEGVAGSRVEGAEAPKHKSCQCCSVM